MCFEELVALARVADLERQITRAVSGRTARSEAPLLTGDEPQAVLRPHTTGGLRTWLGLRA